MEKDNQLFQQMLDAIIPTILEGTKGGGGRWPMPVFETSFFVGYYDSALIAENFLRISDELLNQGKNICDIAQFYQYPSRIARFSHVFPGRSMWNIDTERQKVLGFRIAKMLDCLYKKNSFNKNNKNLIYSEEEVDELIQSDKFISRETISQVKKLSNLLWLLAETYSPRFPNIFFEFSGEYKVGGSYIIIKDYHDLIPDYLTFEIPYNFNNIKIIEIHNIPIDYKVDIMCRSLPSNQNIPAPEAILLIVDGKFITDVEIVADMNKKILSALKQSTEYLNSLSRDEIIIWNATIDLYAFLYPLIGKDCYKLLPKNYLEELNSEAYKSKYNKAVDWFKSIPKDADGWTTIFDVRKSSDNIK